MKYKWFLYCYFNILFLEIVFNLLNFSFNISTVRNVVLFSIPVSVLVYLLTTMYKKKGNIISYNIIFTILGILFSFIHIFHGVFNSFFSLCLLGLSDQVSSFTKELFHIIISNIHIIIIFFIPIILFWILKCSVKKFDKLLLNKFDWNNLIIKILVFVLACMSFFLYTVLAKYFDYNTFKIIYEINDISLSENKLGVINSSLIDSYKFIFGFDEAIQKTENEVLEEENNPSSVEVPVKYDLNVTNIDLNALLNTDNSKVNIITDYIQDTATYKNKYTGMFEGMNVVYIVAESFSEIAVSEELTPTLYKLINSGFSFNNYYTPNVLSTIGGEFQAVTSLYPVHSILGTWKSGKNYFPYGIATTFKNNGYNTYAYHNNSYTFQNRNIYLKSMGFDNFKGCYNGMEKLINCRRWPQSDVEMINATIDDYISSEEPFLAYYMTVSGHFEYNWDNSMSRKWKEYVEELPYSTKLKAYVATQMELDRALETLINKLEENEKLDNTVIVLLADHYPYDLNISEVNTLSKYQRDEVVEVNHNNLIIWNNKMETVKIDKVAMSIDVLPTIYNLLGFEYDSRLFIGKDILSTNIGLAIFSDRSWVTNKGTYFARNNQFISKTEEEISDDYIKNMNNIVANKINISQKIMETNYYNYLK